MSIDKILMTFPLHYHVMNSNAEDTSLTTKTVTEAEINEFKKEHLKKYAIDYMEKYIDVKMLDRIDLAGARNFVNSSWKLVINGFFNNFYFAKNDKEASRIENLFEKQLYDGWIMALEMIFPANRAEELNSISDIFNRMIEVNDKLWYKKDYSELFLVEAFASTIRDDTIGVIANNVKMKWKLDEECNKERFKNNQIVKESVIKKYEAYKEYESSNEQAFPKIPENLPKLIEKSSKSDNSDSSPKKIKE